MDISTIRNCIPPGGLERIRRRTVLLRAYECGRELTANERDEIAITERMMLKLAQDVVNTLAGMRSPDIRSLQEH